MASNVDRGERGVCGVREGRHPRVDRIGLRRHRLVVAGDLAARWRLQREGRRAAVLPGHRRQVGLARRSRSTASPTRVTGSCSRWSGPSGTRKGGGTAGYGAAHAFTVRDGKIIRSASTSTSTPRLEADGHDNRHRNAPVSFVTLSLPSFAANRSASTSWSCWSSASVARSPGGNDTRYASTSSALVQTRSPS